jgi:hypothetical protein
MKDPFENSRPAETAPSVTLACSSVDIIEQFGTMAEFSHNYGEGIVEISPDDVTLLHLCGQRRRFPRHQSKQETLRTPRKACLLAWLRDSLRNQ